MNEKRLQHQVIECCSFFFYVCFLFFMPVFLGETVVDDALRI